jgi:hypothetical protein
MNNKLRNKPCECGSGIKNKKCCKGVIKTENVFDYKKWYKVTMNTLDDNKESSLEPIINNMFININPSSNLNFSKKGKQKFVDYNMLLLRLMTSFLNHQNTGVLPFSNQEIKSITSDDYIGDIITHSSLFETNLSKEEKKYIIDSIVDFYDRLQNLLKKLELHSKIGYMKNYRTQKIDIKKTNVFSCFDDWTYYMMEWFYDNMNLLKKFIDKEVIGELIRKFYLNLGKPKNRIELENNTIEKLLNLVRNDEELLNGFRTEITGWIILDEDYPHSLKNGDNSKYFNEILDRVPLINKVLDDNPFLEKMVNGLFTYNTFHTHHYYGGEKVNSYSKSKRYNVDWLNRLNDDDMVSLYRGVSDKNYPMGWSWTLDKQLGLGWIRGRGLVEDGGLFNKSVVGIEDTTHLVEVRVPKSELMMVFSTHNKFGDYGEIVMTEESLKGYKLKIIDFNPNNIDETKSLFLNDIKLRTSLFHTITNQLISPMTGSLDSLDNESKSMFIKTFKDENNIKNTIKSMMNLKFGTNFENNTTGSNKFHISIG